jgi:hypothetical protein
MYIMDTPRIFETRFLSRHVLLVSFNAHKRVGDQECFIPRDTVANGPGEKAAHMGARVPSGQVTNVSNSLDAWLH